MNPVDLLGAKISILVRIGMTHPHIEKRSPLSLPEYKNENNNNNNNNKNKNNDNCLFSVPLSSPN